jgi:hypothetical protein
VTEQPQTEEYALEHDGSHGDRLESLESKVDGIVETLKKILHTDSETSVETVEPEAEEPDVASQVKAELAKLKAAEDRKAKAEARDKEMDELKETGAKIKEKPPREYRKVTQFMQWGDPEN